MADENRSAGPDRSGPIALVIEGWALLGGITLLVIVAINTISVVGAAFGKPFPGDFELTEIGVAVAAFAFLPWCQLTGAHVTADIFTSRASPRTIALLGAIASIIATIFAVILLWRMYAGMIDQKTYGYTTAILQIPHWWAFAVILVSLALWVVAAIASLAREIREARH